MLEVTELWSWSVLVPTAWVPFIPLLQVTSEPCEQRAGYTMEVKVKRTNDITSQGRIAQISL